MLYPSIGELVKGDNKCRYSLVIAVSQKAREIAEAAEKTGEPLSDKPITLAIKAFAKVIGLSLRGSPISR